MKHLNLFSLKVAAAVIVTAVSVAACAMLGPQYATSVDYAPPTTIAGQHCLNQCDANMMMCRTTARADYDRCEVDLVERNKACVRDAEAARNYCILNNSVSCDLSYSNKLAACRQSAPTCEVELRGCERQNDTCFERCGGTITRTSTCVRNCD